MAKEWFSYNYIAKIAKVERHNNPKKSIKGEFFETWDEAWRFVNRSIGSVSIDVLCGSFDTDPIDFRMLWHRYLT